MMRDKSWGYSATGGPAGAQLATIDNRFDLPHGANRHRLGFIDLMC
jgi:hypothetical protein